MLSIESLTLEDTIPLMKSECFKDRLRAEYYQTAIRLTRLDSVIEKWENGHLDFIPRTTLDDYKKQAKLMRQYIYVLVDRCPQEGADLDLPLTYLYNDEEEDFDE